MNGFFIGGQGFPGLFILRLPGRDAPRARPASGALLFGFLACFQVVRRHVGRFFRRASAGLFGFRFFVCGELLRVGFPAGSTGGFLFFGRRVRGGGLSGSAGFCSLDFFSVLFGKNGVLTHVILKNCDATSAFQPSEGDFYAGARKREQGIAAGGKGAGIGNYRASYALYSC